MKRRNFIAGFGGAVALSVTAARAARAQTTTRMRRIGLISNYAEGDPQARALSDIVRERLKELGWIEGQNIHIDQRWAGGNANRRRAYVAELLGLNPDVIYGVSTPTIAALKEATQTVPIVFVNANNPVGSGFVASMARPGANITGFMSFEPSLGGKWLELLKELVPGLVRVGLVHNPRTHTGQYFASIEAAGRLLSIRPMRLAFRDAAEIERAINDFSHEPNGGLLVLPDSSNTLYRESIIRAAARHRLPAVYSQRVFVDDGGLAHYGANTWALFRQAAEYVDRILKGDKPANLPVQAPATYELVLNLKAAKALGIDVPLFLQQRADVVIE